jgi:exosortase
LKGLKQAPCLLFVTYSWRSRKKTGFCCKAGISPVMRVAFAGPKAAETIRGVAGANPWCRSLRGSAELAGLGLCVAWAYWPTFQALGERWWHDPQYSHGFLVPAFALVVLWSRRDRLPSQPLFPSWWGVGWLVIALGMRLTAGFYYLEPLDGLSLLPALAGICLLLGGGPALRWCWPAIAFLGFMLPLPFRLDVVLAVPLRQLATNASVYLLQTLGLPAFAEGNVIVLDELRLGVVEACSGLGMLMTFFALATAVAVLIDRPLSDRLVLVASAVPIALVANIARITATAVAYRTLGADAAHAIMHDLAGWLMMPLALGLMWLELRLLNRLLPEVGAAGPLPLFLSREQVRRNANAHERFA